MHFLTFSKNCVPHVNGVFMFLGCYCNNNSQFLFPLFKWMQNRRKISKLEITTQIWHSCHYYIIVTTELGIIYILLHSKQYTKQVYIRQHTCIHSDVTLCLFSRILCNMNMFADQIGIYIQSTSWRFGWYPHTKSFFDIS